MQRLADLETQEEPLVSIIIPTYNRPAFLGMAIESALKQKYSNIEIIVSDDHSQDTPQSIVDSFEDSRIRLRSNTTNLGQCLNNLAAFQEAKGKYVANLHDDDMWSEDFLVKLVPIMESNENIGIAFCDQIIIDGQGRIDEALTHLNTERFKRNLLREGIYKNFYKLGLLDKSIPTVMSALIRKACVNWQEFPPQTEGAYDLYLTYLIAKSNLYAYYLPERLTYYRSHHNSATGTSNLSWIRGQIFCYERFLQDEDLRQYETDLRLQLAKSIYTLGVTQLRTHYRKQAFTSFKKSMFLKLDLRTFIGLVLCIIPDILLIKLISKF